MLKYVLAWIPMVLIGVANGIVRVSTYGRYMSELRAHQVSTLTGIALMGFYTLGVSRILKFQTGGQAFLVGLIWLVLTVGFEFSFGHYVAGHDWSRLLSDYDLASGRLWLIFLLYILVAPYIFYRLGK